MGEVVVESLAAVALAARRRVANREAANRWDSDAGADTYVFSYKNDFAALWGLNTDENGDEPRGLDLVVEELAGTEATIAVVWDGQPADSAADAVAVGSYVTAYDWAAALSLVLYRRFATSSHPERRPKIRILIFDIASHLTSAGFVQRSFFGFHNAFPWIQDYRPVASGAGVLAEVVDDDPEVFASLRQAIPPESRDIGYLVKDLLHPERILTTFADGLNHGPYLKAFAESWRQHFLRAGDRHSVANLIGPMVLAQGLPSGQRPKALASIEANALPRRALRETIVTLGLADESQEWGSRPKRIQEDGGAFGRYKGVRFMLIDDQYRLGYQHILGYMIFGSDYAPGSDSASKEQWMHASNLASLTCVDHWGAIEAALRSCSPVSDWSLPRGLVVAECDVLILDLRLWLNSELAARKAFMQSLTQVCADLNASRIKDLRFRRALAAATALSRDGQEVSELPALALLPLLISHYDPSFPIVLFSSTHQREVLELVGHRPNIITDFSKPLLTGYGADMGPEESLKGLSVALRRALEMHESRIVWERICEVDWDWKPPFSIRINKENIEDFNFGGGGSYAPSVSGDHLRRKLKSFYQHYLLDERYFDFASLPYELIEGALNSKSGTVLLATSDVIDDGASVDGVGRNELARALRTIRNRKAHGYAKPPSNDKERKSWRLASILCFMLLLDYIRVVSAVAEVSPNDNVRRYWEHLRNRFGSRLGRLAGRGYPPYPKVLVECRDLPTINFVVYTVLYALKNGLRKGFVPVTDATRDAALFLSGSFESLSANSSRIEGPSNDAGQEGSEELVVVSVSENGFYVGEHEAACGFCENYEMRPDIGAAVRVEFDYSRFTEDGYFYVQFVG